MTRASPAPANLEIFAAQTARLLDINLPRGGAALVAVHLEILLNHSRAFVDFDLPPECEPLPEYEP